MPLCDAAARRGKRAATSRTATASRTGGLGRLDEAEVRDARSARSAPRGRAPRGRPSASRTSPSGRRAPRASTRPARRPRGPTGRSTETTNARPGGREADRARGQAVRRDAALEPRAEEGVHDERRDGQRLELAGVVHFADRPADLLEAVVGLPRVRREVQRMFRGGASRRSTRRRPAMRRRAISKPSPPLLPGPARTTTRAARVGRRARTPAISRTTAFAARFMRTKPGVPAAIVLTSRARASSAETTLTGGSRPRRAERARRVAEKRRKRFRILRKVREEGGEIRQPVDVGHGRDQRDAAAEPLGGAPAVLERECGRPSDTFEEIPGLPVSLFLSPAAPATPISENPPSGAGSENDLGALLDRAKRGLEISRSRASARRFRRRRRRTPAEGTLEGTCQPLPERAFALRYERPTGRRRSSSEKEPASDSACARTESHRSGIGERRRKVLEERRVEGRRGRLADLAREARLDPPGDGLAGEQDDAPGGLRHARHGFAGRSPANAETKIDF